MELISKVENKDCMEAMREFPDKYFDLAIVDPPYGIGEDWKKRKNTAKKYKGGYKNESIPDQEYFDELKRVSKNWIVWGWNYYTKYFEPTNYLIVWDKKVPEKTCFYSQIEIAATNIKIPASLFRYSWDGARKEVETGIDKIHPHQKPIALYRWLLGKYANPGDKILDTHLGSGSSRIAAYDMGFDFWGYELDAEYFQASETRFQLHIKQPKLFTPSQQYGEQLKIV